MGRYFDELKRRNVFRVAAAYAVVGWLVIEVVDTLAPRMALPEWVPGFVILIILTGFPIALVFSWAFELTPEGLKKTEEVDENSSIASSTGQRINYIIIGALAAVVLFQQFAPSLSKISPFSDDTDDVLTIAIAVLPFSDLSPDGDQEYFGDGVAEEILNVLASVDGLKVTSRTSAFAFKDQVLPVPEIANILNVSHVVEGSIRKQGDRVRITAQLIDVADDSHIWSDTYDSDLSDIFRLQDEIAGQISAALSTNLDFQLPSVERETPDWNVAAYELYLQAHQLVVGREDYIEAIDLLDTALKLEPEFPDAWAQKATALSLAAFNLGLQSESIEESWATYELAWSAARKATEFEPDHPLGLAVKGLIRMNQWRWIEARVYYERALNVSNPDDNAYLWLGILQSLAGDTDGAIETFDSGLEKSPTAPNLHRWRTRMLIHLGHSQEVWDNRDTTTIAAMPDTIVYQQLAGLHLGEISAEQFVEAIEHESVRSPEQLAILTEFARSRDVDNSSGFFSLDTDYIRDLDPLAWFDLVDYWPELILPLVFRDLPAIIDRPNRNYLELLWYENAAYIRQKPEFSDLTSRLNLRAYWELYGWPSMCRPVEVSDLACD